jgi:hypothetical protein
MSDVCVITRDNRAGTGNVLVEEEEEKKSSYFQNLHAA